MKFPILFLFLFWSFWGQAQSFTYQPSGLPAPSLASSSVAFADVDGDGDQDALIMGGKVVSSSAWSTIVAPINPALYLNDGGGNFIEMAGTPFTSVMSGSIAFADIDGDNDPDVLISGSMSSTIWGPAQPTDTATTKLYINDGSGNFSEMMGTPFEAVHHSSIAFSDIDGDNDLDVLITGDTAKLGEGTPVSILYTNDGTGNFVEVIGTPFRAVSRSSIAFADIDGDNDPDVLITGKDSSSSPISELYTNDGSGTFVKVPGSPFEAISSGSVAFGDVNGDSHPDVLIAGNGSPGPISALYINDGAGNFSGVSSAPFDSVGNSSVAFIDIDGDNDQDVLIAGGYGVSSTKLYSNDGTGNFSELSGSPFPGIFDGSIAVADVDGDLDQDFFMTGIYRLFLGPYGSTSLVSELYTNDGGGNFELAAKPHPISNGSIASADVDGDQDPDILVSGYSSYWLASRLFSNDGTGDFSEVIGSSFEVFRNGSIAFADVDGDLDQDLLITGEFPDSTSNFIPKARYYHNDGSGTFTEVIGTPFEGVSSSSIAFADVDGDTDLDVLITGTKEDSTGTWVNISTLYTNNGAGNFSQVIGNPFEGVRSGSIAFADVDGDTDQDVLISGLGVSTWTTKLYLNDGTGDFSEQTGTPFQDVFRSDIAFSDVDGDNDQDVLITGADGPARISKLYTNDGAGNFSEVLGTPFLGVRDGSVDFFDADGDNDPDVLITGSDSAFSPIAKLYTNNGTGGFTEVLGTPFEPVLGSSVAIVDVDGDTDLDVFITGLDSLSDPVAKLYTNDLYASTGGVSFFITELDSTPVVSLGTTVSLFNADNSFSLLTSDSLGGEMIANIPCGTYSYIISKPCFQSDTGTVIIDCPFAVWDTVFSSLMPDTVNDVSFSITEAGGSTISLGATVSLFDSVNSFGLVSSDSSGGEMIVNVPYGIYRYSISKPCFQTDTGTVVIDCNGEMAISISSDLVEQVIQTDISQDGTTLRVDSVKSVTSYQWMDCETGTLIPGANDSIFTPMKNGTYAVLITENACTDTSACVVVNSVGIDNSFPLAVEIYPNPAENIISIDMGGNRGQIRVRLINDNGQVLLDEHYESQTAISLDVGQFADGMYLVWVDSEKFACRKKVIKQ